LNCVNPISSKDNLTHFWFCFDLKSFLFESSQCFDILPEIEHANSISARSKSWKSQGFISFLSAKGTWESFSIKFAYLIKALCFLFCLKVPV
jgi:hypothetical protein